MKYYFRLVLVYNILLFQIAVEAQLNYQHFTTSEGLPHNITYEIRQDNEGFIWIGSELGVIKYDGEFFELINKVENQPLGIVVNIIPLSKDSIVLGSWGNGVFLINSNKNQYFRTDSLSRSLKIKHLEYFRNVLVSSSYVSIFNIDLKNKFKNEEYYLTKYNDKYVLIKTDNRNIEKFRFQVHNIDNTLYFYYEPKNTVSKTSGLKGLYKLNKKIETDVEIEAVSTFLKSKKISGIEKFEDEIFVSTNDSIFIMSNDFKKIKKTIIAETNGTYIIKILKSSESNYILMTIDEKGIKYVYQYNNGETIDLNKALNLKNSISDILIDHEKSIWISSYGEGLFKIPFLNNSIKYINKSNFELPYIIDIKQKSKNEIYLLSHGAVYVSDENANIIKKYILKTQCNELIVFYGKIYASCVNPYNQTYGSQIIEIDGTKRNFIENLGEMKIIDSSAYLNDQKIPFINGFNALLKSVKKRNHLENYWISDDQYLYSINFRNNDLAEKYDLIKEFQSNRINEILEKGNRIWVATDRNLSYIEHGKVTKVELSEEKNHTVFDLAIDNNNSIWAATHSGLYIISDNDIKYLSENTGLLSNYCRSIEKDYFGRMWVSGEKGVTILEPNYIDSGLKPIFNVEQDNCSFDINAISYTRTKALQIEYRISTKKDWIAINSKGIDFCELKPDSYNIHFRYRSSDSDWHYSEQYHFSIIPIWYESW